MSELKEELIAVLKKLFEEYEKKGVDYDRVQWELDYVVYPHIGSYLATGELSKEEGKEVFEFCERKLKELKDRKDSRR